MTMGIPTLQSYMSKLLLLDIQTKWKEVQMDFLSGQKNSQNGRQNNLNISDHSYLISTIVAKSRSMRSLEENLLDENTVAMERSIDALKQIFIVILLIILLLAGALWFDKSEERRVGKEE